ncbi:MAG TPA: insulinase family protein [Candidatus Elarobacter sp.]|nr:insulinase family protein [Candidatus Elarobacter sp.]
MTRRAAALLALVVLGATTLAPAAAAPTTVVDLGGARAYVRADAVANLVVLQLYVGAGLDRQTPQQNGLAALVAESVLQTPVAPNGPALRDAVDAAGGALAFVITPQNVRFSLQGTPDAIAGAAPLLAHALAAPSFAPATLASARAALGGRIAAQDSDARFVVLQMLRESYYRDGAGFPAFGNAGSLTAFAPSDAQAFYAAWYRRGDAFVAAAGRTGAPTDAAGRILVGALPAGSGAAPVLASRPFAAETKRIVTHRDVVAPYVGVGFAAPPLGDPDFAAALVMRALLHGVFERSGATTPLLMFSTAGSLYGYETSPAQFVLWINGDQIDPSVGLGAVIALLKGAATKPFSPAVLGRYKETARGEWALETLSLDDRATAVGSAVARGLDADAADTVPAAIAAVTPADVERVAKKYFQKFDVALVMPRAAGSDGG